MTTEQVEQIRTGEVDTSTLPVGTALRVRREQLGWSLPDVAAWLRIKLPYLEALEGGQVSKLPGNAYALGFLRAYAGVLGLDCDDMARRFRLESRDVARKPELAFPAPVPERGVPAGAMVLLGVVVVVGAYAGWYEFTARERRQTHVVPPVPAALLPYAGSDGGPRAGPATSPQVAMVMPGPGQTPSPLPQPASVPVSHPVPSAGQALPPAAVVPTVPAPAAASAAPVAAASLPAIAPLASPVGPPSAPAATTAGAMPAASPPATVSPAPVVTAPPGQITLKAVAATWVQVRQVGGKVLYDHVLQAGDSWVVPADAGTATVTTGNAGGLTLMADGVTTAVLGRNGSVRRNIQLDAASIRDGSVATVTANPLPSSADGGVAAGHAHPVAADPADTPGDAQPQVDPIH